MIGFWLGALVAVGYAASLWWLLRRETNVTLLALAILSAGSLMLRLVFPSDYPGGLNDDETLQVVYAAGTRPVYQIFGVCVQGGCLQSTLFQLPLLPLLGPSRWTIRAYSLVTSVLAAPAGFAVSRGMGMRLAPSLSVAAFIACLPWSIFYGRVSIGGEMIFHQVLLLAALARLVWASGGLVEAVIGALALWLLLYSWSLSRTAIGRGCVSTAGPVKCGAMQAGGGARCRRYTMCTLALPG